MGIDWLKFENDLCDKLSEYHYWALHISNGRYGQPADIIAINKNKKFLIDCKLCKNNKFVLSRIEFNQHLAMRLFANLTDGSCWFALKIDTGIYMISYKEMMKIEKKSINKEEIMEKGIILDRWISENNNI